MASLVLLLGDEAVKTESTARLISIHPFIRMN